MENGNESSSNGSNSHGMFCTSGYEPGAALEFVSNLEKLLLDAEYDYTDAEIVIEGISVGVNRCILALRSRFFHELFRKRKDRSILDDKAKYILSELVPYGTIGYESFMVVLNYMYAGKLKPPPPEVATCIDDSCAHETCRPAINYTVELMCASATFQMKELVEFVQHRLLTFVDMASVEDTIPIVLVAFHCHLNRLLSHCIQRLAKSDLLDIILEKELPHEVSTDIKSFRNKYCKILDPVAMEVNLFRDKRIRMMYKAIHSNDLELFKSLLDDSDINLSDGAFPLHYAAAYCDPKFVNEVVGLSKVNVNLRNSQGYTMLHLAAKRMDQSIIMELIKNGASTSDTTKDGKTALTLCRRMISPKDYNEKAKQGQDWFCIDLLEKEMADDLHRQLLFLESMLAMARILLPSEVKLEQIADADFVDLNETLSEQEKRLQSRVETLQKIEERGRKLFPSCFKVVDSILEDDIQMDVYLEHATKEQKKRRFLELKEEVSKAFDADKEKNQTYLSLSPPGESDTLLLERARKLLQGHKRTRKKYRTGSFSSSSSYSVSPLGCGNNNGRFS